MCPAPDGGGGRLRAGFLGPAGTFSEEALLASVARERIEPVGLASIYETVQALQEQRVELAIVPIENSLEGSISVTLDLLAAEESDVRIVGEELLRVRHSLIACEQVALEAISTVTSHPQVPGQCQLLLRGELAHAQLLPASSTAEAVRVVVAGGDPSAAALGTALAARIYGGVVVREDVQDRADNETRFVWLARAGDERSAPPFREDVVPGPWRCSIVFWGRGTERPGWLVGCLNEFAAREVNLTKIESRPRRREMGSYMFFADLAASESEPLVEQALAGLRSHCEEVHVLGCYRSAQPARERTAAA
jgi:prephenate dehydratase